MDEVPQGSEWQYEPKWDGFRCLAFRDGDEVQLQSKAGQPLARYFPELVEALRELKPGKFVIDSEIAIPVGQKLSFEDLQLRLHPAESRVRKLARETPSIMQLFKRRFFNHFIGSGIQCFRLKVNSGKPPFDHGLH